MRLPRPLRDIRTISRLFTTAETEAGRDGAERPGPEHLVLSACALSDGSATRALERLAFDPDGLRAAVVAAHGEALRSFGLDRGGLDGVAADEVGADAELPPGPAPSGPYRLTEPGRWVYLASVDLAKASRQPLLGAHVLAAACELEVGTFARALAHAGIDRDELAAAARREAERG